MLGKLFNSCPMASVHSAELYWSLQKLGSCLQNIRQRETPFSRDIREQYPLRTNATDVNRVARAITCSKSAVTVK
jgi:hypothetical protein